MQTSNLYKKNKTTTHKPFYPDKAWDLVSKQEEEIKFWVGAYYQL